MCQSIPLPAPLDNGWTPVSSVKDSLPVFRGADAGRVLYYTPGTVAVVPPGGVVDFETGLRTGEKYYPGAQGLLLRAYTALERWNALLSQAYEPLCLMLYLNRECNLRCAYCYADPVPGSSERLTPELAAKSAELIATRCRAVGRDMVVVFHGGGEPTHTWMCLVDSLAEVENAARRAGVGLFRYIATNGTAKAERMRWLADHFDLVGLSCDGPEWIQARQRPLRNGKSSLEAVERAAGILRAAGRPFDVRVTVTPFSMNHQAEIAAYLCRELQPRQIHVEPVYQGTRTLAGQAFLPGHAEGFTAAFLKARAVAAGFGTAWCISESRAWEIHGPYCNILRGVLAAIPGGALSACFKVAETKGSDDLILGQVGGNGSSVNLTRIKYLRERLSRSLDGCALCFNRYHCTRGCPDSCLLDGEVGIGSFRCDVQRRLADNAIREKARRHFSQDPHVQGIVVAAVEPD